MEINNMTIEEKLYFNAFESEHKFVGEHYTFAKEHKGFVSKHKSIKLFVVVFWPYIFSSPSPIRGSV